VYRSLVSFQPQHYWQRRRVLITGASGFVGTWLCRLLKAAGAQVHGLGMTRDPTEASIRHRGALLDCADTLLKAVNPDTVFHLASPIYLGEDPAQLAQLRSGIIDSTAALVRACPPTVRRFVHIGSCAEYGDAPSPHRENTAVQSNNTYGKLKAEATQMVLAAPFNATVLRPFRAIGPGDTQSVLAAAATAALTGQPFPMTQGNQVREWNHIACIATAIMAAGSHPEAQGEVINIGGGESRSVIDLVRGVFGAAQADSSLIDRGARPQRKHEVSHLVGDHTKAQALWGHLPQPSLDDTIDEAVQWTRHRLGGPSCL